MARRSAASMEAYLGVLQAEAAEAAARNEAQQRRLETLTAENSKLKKEAAKLRSEATGSRMAQFEHDILAQVPAGVLPLSQGRYQCRDRDRCRDQHLPPADLLLAS